MRIVGAIIEAYSVIRFVLSPLFFGIIAGAVVYTIKPDKAGLFIGILIILTGLTLGIIWAKRVKSRGRAIDFISQVHASPDLDQNPDEKH